MNNAPVLSYMTFGMTYSADREIAHLRQYLKYVTNKCEISLLQGKFESFFARGAKLPYGYP